MRAVLQSEASECGLACLATVASRYRKHVGLAELRLRFSASLKGATLTQLMAMAGELGFQCRPVRAEPHELRRLRLPCILHWNFDHFVVLARAGRRKLVLLDPASGRRELDPAQFSRHFTGVALELTPEPGFRPQPPAPRVPLRRMLGRVEGLWPGLAMILLLSAALQVFVLLNPFLLQWVVDQVLVSSDRDLLTLLGMGFGLLLLLQAATAALRGWAVVQLSSRIGLQWMGNVFAHLLRLPMDFFAKRHLGDIDSRLGSVQAVQRTLTTGFVEAAIDGLMAIATLCMMLLYSARLAMVTLLAVAAYLALRMAVYRPLRAGTERQLVAAARQQGHLLESIRGIQSIKLGGTEAFRCAGYANLMQETVRCEIGLARLGLGFGAAGQLVFGAERIAAIWLGASLALQNVFSVGMLIAYLAYKDQFAGRMGGLVDKWIEFRMLRLHGERLADIVLSEPEPERLPAADADIAVAAACSAAADDCGSGNACGAGLEARDLWFRYAAGEPWILRGCRLAVAPGESVAIVGPSGAGKTTLVKLLLGLWKPERGWVRIEGADIARMPVHAYRRMTGAVMQDDRLFAGSLLENIAFGEGGADRQRAEAAARAAAVHEDIAAMPMGYHSLVGDMGSALSGGQRQRVLLARVLYRRPALLFLDEATSHLDLACERRVGEAVRALRITRIVIAHRPETIASADRVLMLRDGRLVELGPASGGGPAPAPDP